MINFLADQRFGDARVKKNVQVELRLGKWSKGFAVTLPRAYFTARMAHRDFGGIRIGARQMPFRVYYPTAKLELEWKSLTKVLGWNMFRRPRLLTGVDIGSDSIKVVRLREDGQELHLERCERIPLPLACIVDGAVMNFSQLSDALRDLVKNMGADRRVALAVSGHSVIIKEISLPEMSKEQLDSSIMWEVEQYIPFDLKEVYVGWEILDPHAGQGQMDVLLCAAKKDLANDYISVAREVGLEPVMMGVNTQAVYLPHAVEGIDRGCVAVVNVGASMIQVTIWVNGRQVFSRDMSLGGSLLTEEIQRALSVTFDEAKAYQEQSPDQHASAAVHREVSKLADRVSGTLVTEIQRSFEFFQATSVDEHVERVYVTGGMARSVEFVRTLEQRLGSITLIDPFKGIRIDPNKFGVDLLNKEKDFFAVATGLALQKG